MGPRRRIYFTPPGADILKPDPYPKRPDIFDTVPLAPALTEDDAFLARRFWQQPDDALGRAWRAHKDRPYARASDEDGVEMHVLANNVYEHLMSSPFLPVSREYAQARFAAEGLDEVYNGVRGLDAMEHNVFVRGLDVKDPKLWTNDRLKEELDLRGLSTDGLKKELQHRLWEYECDKRFGVLKLSDLSHWGITREPTPVLCPAVKPDMSALDMYTAAIKLSPYNPTYWASRGYCHYLLGYFDLAIGDAYRGELLCEVLTTASKRNKRPGLYTRVWDAIQQHLMAGQKMSSDRRPEITLMRKANGINYFIPTLKNALHSITSLSLAALNCWDDFTEHMESHLRRPLSYRDVSIPRKRLIVSAPVREEIERRRRNPSERHPSLYGHEWSRGWISGADRYPYDKADVKREAPEFINALNANVFTVFPDRICQVQPITKADGSFNGLGVFATKDIQPGTVLHYEEPVIRGHLIPHDLQNDYSEHPLHAPRCDNCQEKLELDHIERNWVPIHTDDPQDRLKHSANCACLNMICDCSPPPDMRGYVGGLFFCSPSQTKSKGKPHSCREIARTTYHFSEFCGLDWGWLHDAMRPNIAEWAGDEYFTHNNEKHGTILSLLLKSVLELTLHRRQEDPNLLAHEINELLILEAGTDSNKPWKDSWFPFTLAANIQVPFDILLNLGVDIFSELSFDTWVLQIVLRKLLVNAVPWEHARRGKNETFTETDGLKPNINPQIQLGMMQEDEDFSAMDPSFSNLYIFPGLNMFNHSCRPYENAQWGYDRKVPNRVVIWAHCSIKAGEEIRIPYQRYRIADAVGEDTEQNMHAGQMFGRNCECPRCQGRGLVPPTGAGKPQPGSADWTPGPVTYPPRVESWDGILVGENPQLEAIKETNYKRVREVLKKCPRPVVPGDQGVEVPREDQQEKEEEGDITMGQVLLPLEELQNLASLVVHN
ncbi:Tetratricopeptide-like helical [Penicillium sp. DV-2018c]|nr:Tetratricopeptide-like helical [Penicillium sp. DV-2018c]KAJ5563345.1 Tetratricopeptide-like helical [Penicillium sp. DV-2018c]